MIALGIAGGLAAAAGQAGSYLLSRQFLHGGGGRSPLLLLACSNLWMGLFALLCCPFVWCEPAAGWGAFLFGLGIGVGGYVAAQGLFFWTVRFVPASRLAPMLGVKVAFVAFLAWLLGTAVLGPQHWLAVGLTVIAAVAVQRAGDPLPLKGLLGILAVAACFAISDNGCALMIKALGPEVPGLQAALFVLVMDHLAILPAALLGTCLFVRPQDLRRLPLGAALPYSLVWFLAVICLFLSFRHAGVVLGVICQSMRGPLAIVFSLLIARLGWEHLEQRQTLGAIARQLLAAGLMVAAIACYVLAG